MKLDPALYVAAGAVVGVAILKVARPAQDPIPPLRLYFPETVTHLEAVPTDDTDGDGIRDFWVRGVSCRECLEGHAAHAAEAFIRANLEPNVQPEPPPSRDRPRVR